MKKLKLIATLVLFIIAAFALYKIWNNGWGDNYNFE
jgi:hypothetical protein